MAATVYQTLTKSLKVTPKEGESEQDFYERVVKLGNKLSDDKFEALPQPCQDWLDEATTAVKEEVAIAGMPGASFEDEDTSADDDETADTEEDEDADTSDDDGDEDTEEEEEEEEEEEAAPKKKGKAAVKPVVKGKVKSKVDDDEDDTSEDDDDTAEDDAETDDEEAEAPKAKAKGKPAAKAAAKPAGKGKGKEAVPVAKKGKAAPEPAEEDDDEEAEEATPPKKGKPGAKGKVDLKKAGKVEKKVEKKNKVIKMGRQRSTDGVLYKLMEAMFEDPTRTASKLVEVVEKENAGSKVKVSNAVGIRQQYRRIVLFLQDKGVVKGLIKAPAAE